jgi:hypothetical protein
MSSVITGLAEKEEVRVMDCGNQIDAEKITRLLKHSPEAMERIRLSSTSSCIEIQLRLEAAASTAIPFVILDFLRPFYDEAVPIRERKNILTELPGGAGQTGKIRRRGGKRKSASAKKQRCRNSFPHGGTGGNGIL